MKVIGLIGLASLAAAGFSPIVDAAKAVLVNAFSANRSEVDRSANLFGELVRNLRSQEGDLNPNFIENSERSLTSCKLKVGATLVDAFELDLEIRNAHQRIVDSVSGTEIDPAEASRLNRYYRDITDLESSMFSLSDANHNLGQLYNNGKLSSLQYYREFARHCEAEYRLLEKARGLHAEMRQHYPAFFLDPIVTLNSTDFSFSVTVVSCSGDNVRVVNSKKSAEVARIGWLMKNGQPTSSFAREFCQSGKGGV